MATMVCVVNGTHTLLNYIAINIFVGVIFFGGIKCQLRWLNRKYRFEVSEKKY
jgi:hypothetical protein